MNTINFLYLMWADRVQISNDIRQAELNMWKVFWRHPRIKVDDMSRIYRSLPIFCEKYGVENDIQNEKTT